MATVKSQRLTLRPYSVEEMQSLISKEQDAEMRQAYQDMLDEMLRDIQQMEWGAAWEICDAGGRVGDLCFKGAPDAEGSVEVGYGIDEPFRNKGFATEAVLAICGWAFSFPQVNTVFAETVPDNQASRKVLGKAGFTECGIGKEGGPLFKKIR